MHLQRPFLIISLQLRRLMQKNNRRPLVRPRTRHHLQKPRNAEKEPMKQRGPALLKRMWPLPRLNNHNVGHLSMSGYRYWITFIDDYLRFRFVMPLKAKSQAFEAFKMFKAFAENQSE